jgi:hypothetical protein
MCGSTTTQNHDVNYTNQGIIHIDMNGIRNIAMWGHAYQRVDGIHGDMVLHCIANKALRVVHMRVWCSSTDC